MRVNSSPPFMHWSAESAMVAGDTSGIAPSRIRMSSPRRLRSQFVRSSAASLPVKTFAVAGKESVSGMLSATMQIAEIPFSAHASITHSMEEEKRIGAKAFASAAIRAACLFDIKNHLTQR